MLGVGCSNAWQSTTHKSSCPVLACTASHQNARQLLRHPAEVKTAWYYPPGISEFSVKNTIQQAFKKRVMLLHLEGLMGYVKAHCC